MPIRRGDLYRTNSLAGDPRRQRVFLVVSREDFLASRYSSAICAPIYTSYAGLPTEVRLDESVGLKHPSTARCDELASVPRSELTNYVGSLKLGHLAALDHALAVAVGIDHLFDER